MKPWLSAPALLLALSTGALAADSVGPGTAAPKLDIQTWYKGTPVKSFDKDKLYVVEFWATWCGPCKQSIPHLTELAKKNTDVKFIGVSIWEDDKDGNIKKFVDEMGTKMDYTVAYSGNKTGMSQSWMTASGQNGIPTAFVIKEGKVEWIGHPMELEKPLEEIKAGKFDEAGFKTKFAKQQEEREAQQKAYKELSNIQKQYAAGKKAEADTALTELIKKYPEVAAGPAASIRLGWYAKDDVAKWREAVKAYASSKDDAKIQMVAAFAFEQTQKGGNLDLGKEAIETVQTATSNSNFLVNYYGGMFYKATKDYASALLCYNKTLELLPSTPYKENAGLADELKKLQAEVAKLAQPKNKS